MQGDGRRRWRDERKKGTMSRGGRKKHYSIIDECGEKRPRCVVIRAASARIADRSRIRRAHRSFLRSFTRACALDCAVLY